MTLFYEYGILAVRYQLLIQFSNHPKLSGYFLLQDIVEGLHKRGHKVSRYRNRISVVCAIAQYNGTILANADYRKMGDVRGF